MYAYFDNAATTAVSQSVADAMRPYFTEVYGNPSSLHSVGQRAAEALVSARETVAKLLNAKPSEIYFTSGGSEADNQAILSAAHLGARKGKKHIISTAFEHHAILHTLKKLEKEGFTVTLLSPHHDGVIKVEDVEAAIQDDTCLVTIMYANNEVGTVQPIPEIGALCRSRKILFHTDAVQAIGHIPVDVQADQIDMLSLSAHKFHGPKGTGVLYCRNGIALQSLIEGGAQERSKRAGTENIPGIVGCATAMKEAIDHLEENSKKVLEMRERLCDGILSSIPHSQLNGDRVHRVPGNLNFCFEGIEGESLLLWLDEKGIAASSGSACTSGSLEPSHVLLSMGVPVEIAHGSLRLSLDATNTMEEVEHALDVLPSIVAYLRQMSPVWQRLQKGEEEYVIQ